MSLKRILIVEDEILIAISLEAALSSGGFEPVGPYGQVEQAVTVAERESLDGAVLDVNLGGTKVFPVADALAARNIPFLFLTGYSTGQLPPQYQDATVLSKPFQEQHIVARIGSMVA